MAFTNFLSGHLSGKGTVGKKAWEWGISQGYSPTQMKVAVQQLSNAGVGLNPFLRGAANPMRGVPGMYSPANPMGQFQGSGGEMGIKSYMTAKMAGYTPQQIKEGAAAGGMILPVRAQAQYEMDMRAINERDQQLDYMKQLIDVVNKPQPQVGRSSSYVVGTGGATEIQQADKPKTEKKWKGTGKWKREVFNTLNTGATSGAGGGTVNP